MSFEAGTHEDCLILCSMNKTVVLKCFSVQSSLISNRALRYLKFPSLRPLVLLIRSVSGRRWIRGVGGMVLTGKSQNTCNETCPSAILSTTNFTMSVSGPIPGLRIDRPRIEGPSYKNKIPTSKRTHSMFITNTSRLILFWKIIAFIVRVVGYAKRDDIYRVYLKTLTNF